MTVFIAASAYALGMARLPDGDPAPADGALPSGALASLAERAFGVYVHVPFCTARCGYCDFNVYVEPDLRPGFVDGVRAELELAARTLGRPARRRRPCSSAAARRRCSRPADVAAILRAVDDQIGIASGAEVTIEGNPESVDAAKLAALREAGVTAISLGMQSAQPHVLRALDRLHTPGRAREAFAAARAAGFDVVGLDLIFGCHAESDADWDATLAEAIALAPDRVSAYELTVEPGTRLAARVRSGELPPPDEDARARRYVAADEAFARAGLRWYEISSWARDEPSRSRHNWGYWTGANWWGVGPGAHSHVGGVRWWNAAAPTHVERRARGRALPGRGPRDARRRRRAPRAPDARAAPGQRRAARHC